MSEVFQEELGSQWIRGVIDELQVSGLPLNTHSNVYEASRVIKSGPGLLFGFTVYSSNGGSQWIQLHDASGLPADGAVPAVSLVVATISNLAVSYIFPGRFFQRGIVICNSSTGPTKTIGSSDCFFDAQFA